MEEEEIGGSCTCGVGEVCSLTKTEGPDAGKVLLECGHGCKCDISACGTKVAIYKDAWFIQDNIGFVCQAWFGWW